MEHGKHPCRSAKLEEAIDNLIETSIKCLHTNAIHRQNWAITKKTRM
jgi:hypothetical protein